jgi:hypothetical protein
MQGVSGGTFFYTGTISKRGDKNMSTQINQVSQKTSKPVAAGILNIIAGGLHILGALGLGIAGLVVGSLGGMFFPSFLLTFLAVPMAIIGVLSIVGGILAIQRKRWGWALAGSIATLISSNILGIIAVILLAISKDEFQTNGNRN